MKKTEISLIDEPRILLNRLRDNYILPEDKYQGILNTTGRKEKIITIYTFLCWLIDKNPKKVHRFWELVLKEEVVRFYPQLAKLKNKLLESFKDDCNRNTRAGNEETNSTSGINGIPNDQLLVFFHEKKSDISLMDEPHILLNQIRDHLFISEDMYQDIINTTTKITRVEAIYESLDTLERTQAKKIRHFWEALFEDAIVRYYPKLQNLKDELLEGGNISKANTSFPEEREITGSSFLEADTSIMNNMEMTDVILIDSGEESSKSDHSNSSDPVFLIVDSDEEASSSGHFNSYSPEPPVLRKYSDSVTPNISKQSLGSSAAKSVKYKPLVIDSYEEESFICCSSPMDQEYIPSWQKSDSVIPFVADIQTVEEVGNSENDDDLKEQGEHFCQVSDSETPAIGKRSLRSSAMKSSTYKCSDLHVKEIQDSAQLGHNSDIIHKLLMSDEIPVICGNTKGVLNKNMMATKGSPCIFSHNKWMFCSEFEILSGCERFKHWKKSIFIDMDELKKKLGGTFDDLDERLRISLDDVIKHEGVPAADSGCTGGPAPLGWYIQTCCCKKVCCDSQYILKNMEEIPGCYTRTAGQGYKKAPNQ
ncbi:uncharacterized protein LOC120538131 [Polypterus senegalus]|uniref:uncharacterized protein LOC120538131 n=1 Tax=Polypterus senegalus TaxID=55291 RepID=UPI001963B222|nr:uncharacterized protein LOC120538131 [Polypterus senegalus]